MASQKTEHMQRWLEARLSEEHWHWLQSRLKMIGDTGTRRDLHISLGLVPRKFGKDDLNLSQAEVDALQRGSNEYWDTHQWSVDATARVLILCIAAQHNEAEFAQLFTDLCRTADLTESITYYRGIALYPHSSQLDRQIGEGLRTNIRAVFEAIAHRNAYPQEHFDQNRWNHMVLKALFIDSTLAPIQGLDERANAELARILCDYAHERWAAKRQVTPELWRCVGPFATGDMLEDLKKVTHSSSEIERRAGLLALSQCPDPVAQQVIRQFPEDAAAIDRGELDWDELSNAA